MEMMFWFMAIAAVGQIIAYCFWTLGMKYVENTKMLRKANRALHNRREKMWEKITSMRQEEVAMHQEIEEMRDEMLREEFQQYHRQLKRVAYTRLIQLKETPHLDLAAVTQQLATLPQQPTLLRSPSPISSTPKTLLPATNATHCHHHYYHHQQRHDSLRHKHHSQY